MMRLKTAMMSAICFFGCWSVYKGYAYLYDYTAPLLSIEGLSDEMWCAGDVVCHLFSSKQGDLSIWVDDVPLVEQDAIVAGKKPYSFTLPTATLANGKHVLKITCADRSYNQNVATYQSSFLVDNVPLQATFLTDAQLKVLQGRTLHVQFQVNKEINQAKVHALAGAYNCFAASKEHKVYECYIPISCDEKPNEYLFSVEMADRVGNTYVLDHKFEIVPAEFKKQIIAVDAQKLKEEKEIGRKETELEEDLLQLAHHSPRQKMWHGSFCAPIEIDRITCDFGTIRTSQERGRYMHKAVDVINKPKSVIWAPQDGIVVLKDRYDMSGNTVVVDHGHGILSLFYHLDDFADIEVGQKITQGKPLGTLGKTGYATGYHLHWEMRIDNVQVDPLQWTQETF